MKSAGRNVFHSVTQPEAAMSNKISKTLEEPSSLPEAGTETEETAVPEAIVSEIGTKVRNFDITGKDPTIKNN
jgi:hypothetical protein